MGRQRGCGIRFRGRHACGLSGDSLRLHSHSGGTAESGMNAPSSRNRCYPVINLAGGRVRRHRGSDCLVGKMAFPQKKQTLPASQERRRFQRVKVHLLGRYMLPDRREFPCQIINMSPGGLALLAPGIGNVGDRVIAYLDHIGRVQGRITRIIDNGFAMTVGATARNRDKLAAQLTWLANRDILNLPEDRRHDRIVPRNPIAMLTLEDGTKMTCRIIDMSLSGAAIAAENRPPLKSMILLGKVHARVVPNLDAGFALEFVHEQMAETLVESVTARQS